jgi:hypothetical protein
LNYKLIKVEKTDKRENFDRASIVGDSFQFNGSPTVGNRFSAYDINKDKYITMSVIQNMIRIENIITITTQHTVYAFEMVEGVGNGD